MLLGRKEHGTRFHLDRIEALNIAFALTGNKAGKPLATWVFITPLLPHFLSNLTKAARKQVEALLMSSGPLNNQQIKKLQALLGAGNVLIVEQCHGMAVYIPPGWMHMVRNEADCVKYAWDFYRPGAFPAYQASSVPSNQASSHSMT